MSFIELENTYPDELLYWSIVLSTPETFIISLNGMNEIADPLCYKIDLVFVYK